MNSSDPNRRKFLKQSATFAAAGVGVAAGNAHAAAATKAEIDAWKAKVGSTFRVGDAQLKLCGVNTMDHSADRARPANCRTHSITPLFELSSGRLNMAEHHYLKGMGEDLYLSPVVAPQGRTGEFFEIVLG